VSFEGIFDSSMPGTQDFLSSATIRLGLQGHMGDPPLFVQVTPQTGSRTLGIDNTHSPGLRVSREDALPGPHFPT
jgi:hypothetical protein